MLLYPRPTSLPPGVEAVERAGKEITHRYVLPPFALGGRRHKDWFKTRIPGPTLSRPQLIQSETDDDLDRSTPDS
jgi:hypothetical protein